MSSSPSIRQIFFDTETTGLNVKLGDRMIEFAGIELINGVRTGNNFHSYFNPDREVDPEASKVNGLTWADLKGAPRFRDKAAELAKYIEGAEMIAYNSGFDEGFLDMEFSKAGHTRNIWEMAKFTDALSLARRMLNKKVKRMKLDDLLDYYQIDRSARDSRHEAMLDCELLIPVYQNLVKGLDLSRPALDEDVERPPVVYVERATSDTLVLVSLSPEAEAINQAYLEKMGKETKVDPIGLKARVAGPRP